MGILVVCLAVITLILIRHAWVNKSFISKGKIKKNRLICHCPPIFLWILLFGESLWTLIFVLALMQDLKVGIGIVEILLYSFGFFISFLLLIMIYICFRYKIVLDLDKQKVIIRRLYLPKKEVCFSEIYECDSETEIIKDKNGKTLFHSVGLLAGGACLENCLDIIINNNKNNEPIDEDELKKMLDFEKSSLF